VEFMVITTDFACFGEACVFWLEQKYGSDSQIRAVYSTARCYSVAQFLCMQKFLKYFGRESGA